MEQIKTSIFSEIVLAIETMLEPLSNLEEKAHLKKIFFQEHAHPFLDHYHQTYKLSFPSIEIYKPLPATVYSVS